MNDTREPGAAPRNAARPMAEMPVRVEFDRRESASRWQSVSWQLARVVPDEDGPLFVEAFRDEAEGYYLNVTTPEPSIFVMWRTADQDDAGGHGEHEVDPSGSQPTGADRPPRAVAVTVSYNEASRWMDGGEQVDRVPMPEGMTAWLVDFVNQHYKPEQSRKRKGPKMSFMDREAHARIAEEERRRFAADDPERT
jgi:hypothetical protein